MSDLSLKLSFQSPWTPERPAAGWLDRSLTGLYAVYGGRHKGQPLSWVLMLPPEVKNVISTGMSQNPENPDFLKLF